MRLTFATLPLFALFAAACSVNTGAPSSSPKQGPLLSPDGRAPASTEGVATADMYPSMSARADENGIHVVAALIYPVGNFLQLGPDDTLTATIGGVTQTMQREHETNGEVHYAATFPRDDTASRVVVSFARGAGAESAPNNVVPLAPAFDVTAPMTARAGEEGGFGVFFDAKVAPAIPAKSSLAFRLDGACVPPASVGNDQLAVSDGEGNVVFDMNRLLDPSAADCALSVELRANSEGTWDPAFDTDAKSDVFEGLQARTFSVTWNPSVR